MKEHVGALCTLALLAVWLPNLFAQGSQPSQPVDPTAQAPATPAQLLRRRFQHRKRKRSATAQSCDVDSHNAWYKNSVRSAPSEVCRQASKSFFKASSF